MGFSYGPFWWRIAGHHSPALLPVLNVNELEAGRRGRSLRSQTVAFSSSLSCRNVTMRETVVNSAREIQRVTNIGLLKGRDLISTSTWGVGCPLHHLSISCCRTLSAGDPQLEDIVKGDRWWEGHSMAGVSAHIWLV